MGGGDWQINEQQIQQQVQTPLETAHISVEHEEDIAHQLVHKAGDNFGWWWIILLMACGALFMFKKKIAEAVRGFLGVKKNG